MPTKLEFGEINLFRIATQRVFSRLLNKIYESPLRRHDPRRDRMLKVISRACVVLDCVFSKLCSFISPHMVGHWVIRIASYTNHYCNKNVHTDYYILDCINGCTVKHYIHLHMYTWIQCIHVYMYTIHVHVDKMQRSKEVGQLISKCYKKRKVWMLLQRNK